MGEGFHLSRYLCNSWIAINALIQRIIETTVEKTVTIVNQYDIFSIFIFIVQLLDPHSE
jgi:hypothetical protein